jgi:phosphoribosylaminoimidazolecarboxamide formyltransferase/IMP cyclohydrolase
VPRYGENPHQTAAVYETVGGGGLLGGLRQHQGKELSYNNLLDADAARRLVAAFDPSEAPEQVAVAIIKHGNPCGVGVGATAAEAYERALACDPMSAFGSIVAVNRAADGALAEAMAGLFVEVVLAPGFDEAALEVFGRKKALRVLECPIEQPAAGGELELRAIDGGFLAQSPDTADDPVAEWTCATERRPSDEELAALVLAWRVVRHVRSNAIVVANALQTVGIGAGQMSRVDSCRIAIDKAQLPLQGTVAGSDAFFPFADGVETLAAAGVTAVVQPGGSKKDDEVVAAANRLGVAMMMPGRRHFRH